LSGKKPRYYSCDGIFLIRRTDRRADRPTDRPTDGPTEERNLPPSNSRAFRGRGEFKRGRRGKKREKVKRKSGRRRR